jgi:hypothetical protein
MLLSVTAGALVAAAALALVAAAALAASPGAAFDPPAASVAGSLAPGSACGTFPPRGQ